MSLPGNKVDSDVLPFCCQVVLNRGLLGFDDLEIVYYSKAVVLRVAHILGRVDSGSSESNCASHWSIDRDP